MGIFDFLKGLKHRWRGGRMDRFESVSPNDEMLIPQQVSSLLGMVERVNSEVLEIQGVSDEMLPECTFFVPNLLAEFRENPKLAMIHGLGTQHAWIRVSMLREAIENSPGALSNYRELFNTFTRLGYDVRKIKYIRFRSALRHS